MIKCGDEKHNLLKLKIMKAVLPRCFGICYDLDTEECQSCLIQLDCYKAVTQPKRKETLETDKSYEGVINNGGWKRMILAVCQKYDLNLKFTDEESGDSFIVDETNIDTMEDVEFLLANEEALTKLLRLKLD